MQYILSEEEYKSLVPKGQIVAPLVKFESALKTTMARHYHKLTDFSEVTALKLMAQEIQAASEALIKELKLPES